MSEFAVDGSFEMPTFGEMYDSVRRRVGEAVGSLTTRFSAEVPGEELPDMAVALNGEGDDSGNGGNGNGNGDVETTKKEVDGKEVVIKSMRPGSTKKKPGEE